MTAVGDELRIRRYTPEDAGPTLVLFERSVLETGRSHYSEEQVTAWLGEPRDPATWSEQRAQAVTLIAERDGRVAGFVALEAGTVALEAGTVALETGEPPEGLVDLLFVHPDHGRRGVATALLANAQAEARALGLRALTTHASLVARPVFERAGFVLVEAETAIRSGVALPRFLLRCRLD